MPQDLHIVNRLAGECPLLEGDQEKWITCCSERFFPLAKRITGGDSLAEDALQESWIKILQAVNHACFNGPKACPWVSTIVANAARDVRRRRTRHKEVFLPLPEMEAPSRTPEALAQEKQLLALLGEIISFLPETYRQVVELRLQQGLSTDQTAGRLHISRAQVKTRLNRAVRMIQLRIDARIGTASH
ncbi:MAG: sigma-70 family RNA polymerase sigma factor [Bryobacterales bacterium]|nr:sigma-70 family RNA polymerase sigma factor [Bryobacterales bacterium]MDE0293605.1 sigma-70 family RNA polymerase sigma factor [Bryobacterales bacterium]